MRNVYLSVLGTSPYVPCNYEADNRARVENVRFVQEATLSLNCRDWTAADRIFILTTEDAYKKNWMDDGQQESAEGLQTRIERLNLLAKAESVDIPSGKTLDEIWQIFNRIYNLLNEGDNVFFDITHAFRSIPMLAIVVLNYAKALKNINLRGIYYGAFEILGGSPSYVENNIPLEKRNVPIFDLSAFDLVMEWSFAVDQFIKSGNASAIAALAKREVRPILAETKGRDESARSIKWLSESLEKFTQIMSTCRGRLIPEAVQQLKNSLEISNDNNFIKPFQPVVERLREEIETTFVGDAVKDGVNAARWCLSHQLVQQGYTILQETIFSYLLLNAGQDPYNDDLREIPSQAIKIASSRKKGEPISREDWHKAAAAYPEITEKIIATIPDDLEFLKEMDRITQERNDLNHAGQNQNAKKNPSEFTRNLANHIKYIESLILTAQ